MLEKFPEIKKPIHTILDCFTGADGAKSFHNLCILLEALATKNDDASKQIIKVVQQFARLIEVADNPSQYQLEMKPPQEPTKEPPMQQKQKFIQYVHSFYGNDSNAIYPMNATIEQITEATTILEEQLGNEKPEYDSVDRERVRDILIAKFGLTFPTS